jgi:hypothetical protein
MRIYLSLLVLCLSAAALPAEVWTYVTTTDGKQETKVYQRQEVMEASGLRITETSDGIMSSQLLDPEGQVLSCELRTPDGALTMVNDRQIVQVRGNWKNRPLNCTGELKGRGFYGTGFDLGVRALIRAKKERLILPLFNLGDQNPGIQEMELSREGMETFQGQTVYKIKVAPTGFASLFWSAHILASADGVVLRYRGNNGPGTPEMVQDLVSVAP